MSTNRRLLEKRCAFLDAAARPHEGGSKVELGYLQRCRFSVLTRIRILALTLGWTYLIGSFSVPCLHKRLTDISLEAKKSCRCFDQHGYEKLRDILWHTRDYFLNQVFRIRALGAEGASRIWNTNWCHDVVVFVPITLDGVPVRGLRQCSISNRY